MVLFFYKEVAIFSRFIYILAGKDKERKKRKEKRRIKREENKKKKGEKGKEEGNKKKG